MLKLDILEYTNMILHSNDIKFEGEDRWTKQFNLCSDYWQKSNDETLSEEERKEAFDMWFWQRQCLELGIY